MLTPTGSGRRQPTNRRQVANTLLWPASTGYTGLWAIVLAGTTRDVPTDPRALRGAVHSLSLRVGLNHRPRNYGFRALPSELQSVNLARIVRTRTATSRLRVYRFTRRAEARRHRDLIRRGYTRRCPSSADMVRSIRLLLRRRQRLAAWCPPRESNPDTFRRRVLSALRLPISPGGHRPVAFPPQAVPEGMHHLRPVFACYRAAPRPGAARRTYRGCPGDHTAPRRDANRPCSSLPRSHQGCTSQFYSAERAAARNSAASLVRMYSDCFSSLIPAALPGCLCTPDRPGTVRSRGSDAISSHRAR